MFDKAVDDNFVDTKEDDHGKDEVNSKSLEHKYVTTRKKKKNHSEELDNSNNSNNNKHDKNSNHDKIDDNNRTKSYSNKKKQTVFILGDSMIRKLMVFN